MTGRKKPYRYRQATEGPDYDWVYSFRRTSPLSVKPGNPATLLLLQKTVLGERCWDAGSPIYLAENAVDLGIKPVGVEYDIPSINRQGIVPIQRVANDNVWLCEVLKTE